MPRAPIGRGRQPDRDPGGDRPARRPLHTPTRRRRPRDLDHRLPVRRPTKRAVFADPRPLHRCGDRRPLPSEQGARLRFRRRRACVAHELCRRIGWGFGLHLATKRRISELEEEKRRLQHDRSGAPEIIGGQRIDRRPSVTARRNVHSCHRPCQSAADSHPWRFGNRQRARCTISSLLFDHARSGAVRRVQLRRASVAT